MESSTMMLVMLTHDFLRDESTHLQPSTYVTRGVGVGYTGGLSLLILNPSAGYTIVFHLKIHHTVKDVYSFLCEYCTSKASQCKITLMAR